MHRRLLGHDNDIQDLAWSPDSSFLISVGLDSKIVIWSGYTFEKLKVIFDHMSHVKGVTFDPANKYFATAADDRTMKIFRFTPPTPTSSLQNQANNFMLETTIEAPFHDSPLTTYFRRCSWSPDGECIAGANAVNGPLSCAVVVRRGTWSADTHLVGHEGPVEVCAFSPRLYDPTTLGHADAPGDVTINPGIICACAGQDRSLSLWTTGEPRPILVAHDLAFKSISDIAWHPDGRSLYVTSQDGSIVAIVFRHDEVSSVLDLDENEKIISKYGASRKGAGVVDGPAALILEERSQAGEIIQVDESMGEIIQVEGSMGEIIQAEGSMGEIIQAEGRMSELMGQATDVGPARASSAVNGQSDVLPATGDPGVTANAANASSGEGPPPPPPADARPTTAQRVAEAESNAARIARLKQRVTYKDGKKRIAPLLVPDASGPAHASGPMPALDVAAAPNRSGAKDATRPWLDLSRPYDRLPQGGLAALLIGNKRGYAVSEGSDRGADERRIHPASRDGGAIPILANGIDGLAPLPTPSAPGARIDVVPDFIRPAVVDPSLCVSQVRLAVPKIRINISYPLDPSPPDDDNDDAVPGGGGGPGLNGSDDRTLGCTLEVRNPAPHVPGHFHEIGLARLSVVRGPQTLWQDFLPRAVLLITATHHFRAAACEDGSIYVWTPAGRRLLNAIVVDSQPVLLEAKDWWLLAVTAAGACHVWNVQSVSCPHPPVSLAPILNVATVELGAVDPYLQPGPAVTSARLNSKGQVLITLSSGDGYMYSPALLAWQRLSERWWAVGSQFWNSADVSVGDSTASASTGPTASLDPGAVRPARPTEGSDGIISYLERHTTREVLVHQRGSKLQMLVRSLFSRGGYPGLENSVSIAHLEERIAAALQLDAPLDFRVNLFMYAKRIGIEGLQAKAEELLNSLLGQMYEDVDDVDGHRPNRQSSSHDDPASGWHGGRGRLCGWDRDDLLKGVVLIFGMFSTLFFLILTFIFIFIFIFYFKSINFFSPSHHDPSPSIADYLYR